MKKKARDPIAAFERENRAARRVGQGSRCNCGEQRPLALIPGSKPTICAACQREKLGHSSLDNHHPAGKANDPTTIPIPVNDHRAGLSPEQYEWPQETWDNPLGSPILAGAACMRGYYETGTYLIGALVIPEVEMLETLDPFLTKRLGPEWWVGTEMGRFAPKRKPRRPEILDNPLRSPILASAAWMRRYCEISTYLAAALLIPKAEMLEALDRFLTKRLGPEWWVGTEMERFAPKRKQSIREGLK